MAQSISYVPELHERAYYFALFQAADTQKNGIIGGAEAVEFFGRSKLPIEVLKNIWTVADQPSTSSLDLKKFAVAVRIIQLTQNGTKGTGPTLAAPQGIELKPVFFEGVPPPQQQKQEQQSQQQQPPPTPQQQQRPPPTPQQPQRDVQQQQQPPPSPSRALVGMDPYSLTPQERSRYETLFPQYAKTEEDGQQFVYGPEAVPLFMRSGVDPNNLRDIWNMVDRNPVDNRLDRLEFALAMHLIVCVSKKNLPLPPGGTLPGSLQALKMAGSGSTSSVAAGTGTGVPSTSALPQAMQGAEMGTNMGTGMSAGGPPPLGSPGSGALGGVSISDAFEGMSTQPAPTPTPPQALPSYVPETTVVEPQQQPSYVHAPEPQQQQQRIVAKPPTPQVQPSYVHVPQQMQSAPSVAGVSSASVGTYEVGNSHQEELEKLKDALQKLRAENVSLKSQLGTMTEEEKHVQQELGQTVTEITALSADLGAQRQQVLDAKNRLLEAKAELKAQRDTKGVLTELISEVHQTKDAIESATETIQAAGAATTASPPINYNNQVAESVDLFDMGAPMTPGIESSGFQNEFGADNTNGGVFTGGVTSIPSSTPVQQQQPQRQAPVEDNSTTSPGTPTYQQPSVEQYQQPPEAGGPPPTPTMYSNYAAVPTPAAYPGASPMPERSPVPQRSQQQQHLTPTNINRPGPMASHMRQSSGFDSGFLMGGQAEMISQDAGQDADNFSVAAHSIASTGGYGYDDQTFEIVEGMKKKAKRADGAARDAEAASSKLAAEADELRSDADRAEANYRSLVAALEEKKKGRFGGGKKKKMKDGAEQAGKDAAEIKQHFATVQARALEAATLAAQTRSEADRLRDEAEAAELQMAAAASAQQKQPALSSVPPQTNTTTNGYGASPKPTYGGNMPAPQHSEIPQYGQMMPMPPSNPMGEYNNNYTNGNAGDAYAQPYGQAPPVPMSLPNHSQLGPGLPVPPPMSLPNPSQSGPGVMGTGGGYDMPSPAAFQQMAPPTGAQAADPYANPF